MVQLDALALSHDPIPGIDAEADALNARYGHLGAHDVIALTADASVLLHIVSEVDRDLPVIFLDTGRLFAETLEYRTRLTDLLGLTDVRTVTPDPSRLAASDPHRALWMTNPDLCCHIRKTEPLQRALHGFDAWFTGRKRFQNAQRAALGLFEADGERIKVNPLASWSIVDLKAYADRHGLPEHPLVAKGYPSIGCVPCTSRVAVGEDIRAGRWRGLDKTECGIHMPLETDGSGI
jgi:phosphoadenosine phosphosulfate reductase